MSNPEFVAMQCDECQWMLAIHLQPPVINGFAWWRATTFQNHSDAWAAARAHGWYIAERDLHWRSDDPEHVSIRTTDLVHWHVYKGGR